MRRIYGYGGGKLHAGCHAAQSAASTADSTTKESTPETAALEMHSMTNSARHTSAHNEGCHGELNFRPAEAAGTEAQNHNPKSAAILLWPLANLAAAKEEIPHSAATAAAAVRAQEASNIVAETAHAMQQLHPEGQLHSPGATHAARKPQPVHCSKACRNCQPPADDIGMACPREAGRKAGMQHCSGASDSAAQSRQSLQRPHELVGRELLITASMLNHSCDPNCLVVRGAGHVSIVTQRPIEVCTCLLNKTGQSCAVNSMKSFIRATCLSIRYDSCIDAHVGGSGADHFIHRHQPAAFGEAPRAAAELLLPLHLSQVSGWALAPMTSLLGASPICQYMHVAQNM